MESPRDSCAQIQEDFLSFLKYKYILSMVINWT